MKVKVMGGAGIVGAGVVKDLLRNPDVSEVVIADIDEEGAKASAAELGDKRVKLQRVDASSEESLKEVMDAGYIIANTIGPNYMYCRKIAEAAVDAGACFCDICDDYDAAEAVLELDGKAKDRKVTVITCLGTSPGITNMLAKRGSELLDETEEIHTYWAVGGSDPTGPSELYHLAHIASGNIPQFLDGKWEQVPALSGAMEVEFPQPVGRLELTFVGHSEPVTLPRFIKGVRTVTNRGGLYPASLNGLVSMVKMLGFFEDHPLKVKGVEISPRDFAVAHFRYILENFPELLGLGGDSEAISVFRVEVTGKKDGESKDIVYTGTNEVVASTARSLSIGVQMIGDGTIKHKGVMAPEGCVPTGRFFRELEDGGGVTLSEETRTRAALLS